VKARVLAAFLAAASGRAGALAASATSTSMSTSTPTTTTTSTSSPTTSTSTPTPTTTSTSTSTSASTSTTTSTSTSASAGSASSGDRLLEANARYLAGEFDDAAARYAALAAEGIGGATLHLNRGNALLRAGRRGEAIASYLRALREDPGDGDAAANLSLARASNVDRLVGAPRRALAERIAERTADRAAALALAGPWVLMWLALAARGVAARRARPWLGAAALVLAVASALGAGLVAARDAELRRTAAVVIVPAAPAREAPEAALRAAFDVHEGTEVEVLEVRGEHARVQLGNGLEGWVPAGALEVV